MINLHRNSNWASRSAFGAAMAATGFAFASPANAGDFDLDTSTIAAGEFLKGYDGASGVTAVNARKRGPGEPEPMHFGSFDVSPELLSSAAFDNNIFRSKDNAISDVRFEVVPVVRAKSNLSRHALNFDVTGKLISYAENGDQNYQDISAKAAGALHIDHAHTLSASVLSSYEHLEKGQTFTTQSAGSPIPVFHNRAAVGLTRDTGRLYGTLSFAADRKDYQDIEDVSGNPLDQDYRDTDVLTGQLQTGYRLSPGFEVIGKFRALRQLNEGNEFGSATSTGYEASAGVKLQTSPLLRFELLAGWGLRDFDDAGASTLQSSIVEGKVEWLPTERMTISGNISRSISADTEIGGQGSVQTEIGAKLDYDIFNNLVGHAGVNWTANEFVSEARTDATWAANVGLDYYFTENAAFTLGYTHEVRDSSVDDYDMSRDVVKAGAKIRF